MATVSDADFDYLTILKAAARVVAVCILKDFRVPGLDTLLRVVGHCALLPQVNFEGHFPRCRAPAGHVGAESLRGLI
jgi:hypothetical protein